jgi:hypothetical protein
MRVRVFSHEMTNKAINPSTLQIYLHSRFSVFNALARATEKKGNKEKESSVRQIGLIYSIV